MEYVMTVKQLLLVAVVAGLIAGCAAAPHTQVEGFPQLKTTVHHEENYDRIYSMCYDSLPTWKKAMIPAIFACAWIDLCKKTCDVYVVNGEYLEHELEHCKGKDHDGVLQAMFDAVKNGACGG